MRGVGRRLRRGYPRPRQNTERLDALSIEKVVHQVAAHVGRLEKEYKEGVVIARRHRPVDFKSVLDARWGTLGGRQSCKK